MKAITYHYIRQVGDLPDNLVYLKSSNFFKQVDWFNKEFDLISKQRFFELINLRNPRSREIILTFDDGFVDHYKYVFQFLNKRQKWGIFFISTGPYKNNQLLDVHRIHLLLSTFGGEKALGMLNKLIDNSMLNLSMVRKFESSTYLQQDNPTSVTEFKQTLNYHIKKEWRKELLEQLIRNIFSAKEEARFVDEFYLTLKQIKEMHQAGMIIGSHGINHYVMSNLSHKDQESEIEQSCNFLSNLLDQEVKIFAYPYGTKKTFNKETQNILQKQRIDIAFTTDKRDIFDKDIVNNIYALPRFDCNNFIFGKNENAK